MSATKAVRRKHWYRWWLGECPVCGRDFTYRERVYGRKPKDNRKVYRHQSPQVACAADQALFIALHNALPALLDRVAAADHLYAFVALYRLPEPSGLRRAENWESLMEAGDRYQAAVEASEGLVP